jgi:hypothetical protein
MTHRIMEVLGLIGMVMIIPACSNRMARVRSAQTASAETSHRCLGEECGPASVDAPKPGKQVH